MNEGRGESGLILILTGGLSRRMGRPKALLPLSPVDPSTFLQTIVKRTSRLNTPVAVVTSLPLRDLPIDLTSVKQEHPEEGQLSSLLLGWETFGKCAAWVMVALVDHPYVSESTYGRLIEARRQHPEAMLWTPSYQKRSGHPVIFSAPFMEQLKDLPFDQGARPLVERHAQRRHHVVVDDSAILWDVDTPEDYRRYQAD